MFSMTIEYALRAASYLSEARGRRVTAQVIAGECRVPVSYMSKVLQAMAEAGLITSQRGPSGGFALAKAPAAITMLDVVDAIDPINRVTECPLELEEHTHDLCRLHHELDAIAGLVVDRLAARTLEDIMTEPAPPIEVRVLSSNEARTNGTARAPSSNLANALPTKRLEHASTNRLVIDETIEG